MLLLCGFLVYLVFLRFFVVNLVELRMMSLLWWMLLRFVVKVVGFMMIKMLGWLFGVVML